MADRLVRIKQVSDTGTTRTITFDEPTPLNGSHLLVLVATVTNATAFTTPSGWSAISGNGNNGTSQLRAWYIQANSSINSVTLVSPNAAVEATLMAFSGFVRNELLSGAGANIASGTTVTQTQAATWTPTNQYGISIHAIRLATAPTTWNAPNSGIVNGTSNTLRSIRKEITNGSSGLSLTNTWTGARAGRGMYFFLPLQPDDGLNGLIVQDTFQRTVSDPLGWYQPNQGSKWTPVAALVSGNNSADVTGGEGRIRQTSGATTKNTSLRSSLSNELFLSLQIKLNEVPVGAGASPRIIHGSVNSGADYHLRLRFNDDGVISYRFHQSDTSTLGTTTYTLPSYTYTNNAVMNVKTWFTGSSPTRLRAKVWPDGQLEPSSWNIDITDSTASLQGVPRRIELLGHRLAAITNTELITSYMNVYGWNVEPTTPSITVSDLNLTENITANRPLTASGVGPKTWFVTGGSLPAGMSLSLTGILYGTPAAAGPYDFTVTLNGSGDAVTQQYTGVVAGETPALPIAEYSFNEGTGSTSADLTGNGHTASITGWTASGHSSFAASPTSGNPAGIINSNLIATPSPYTFMGWIYSTQVDDIFIGYSSFGVSFIIRWDDSEMIAADVMDSSYVAASDTSLVPAAQATWVHVALSVSENGWKLYINGTLGNSASFTNTLPAHINQRIILGGRDGVGTSIVDDVRLFDRALTSAQINHYMSLPAGTLPATIIAEYSFDEGSGTVARDSTGHSHHIPINSAAWTAGGYNNSAIEGMAAGTAPYIQASLANSIATTNIRTLMAWVHFDSIPGPGVKYMIYGGQQGGTSDYEAFGFQGANIFYYRANGGTWRTWDGKTPTSTGWYHFILQIGQNGIKLYINGILAGAYNEPGTDRQLPASIHHIYLGHEGGDFILDGAIDNLRFLDGQITTQQIISLMSTPVIIYAPVQRWFLGSGATLIPYTLTPGGLVELE